MRLEPLAHARDLPFPGLFVRRESQPSARRTASTRRQRDAAGVGERRAFRLATHDPAASKRVKKRSALAGPMPGRSCSARNAAMRFFGLSAQRSTASRSFTCAASRNLSPPYFTYGMLRRTSSSSSRSQWCELRNRTAWRLQRHAPLARFQHARHHVLAPAPGRRPP